MKNHDHLKQIQRIQTATKWLSILLTLTTITLLTTKNATNAIPTAYGAITFTTITIMAKRIKKRLTQKETK
jgi:hypothetical protein